MYFLRLLGVIAAITIAASLLAWTFTGDIRYRDFSFKLLRFCVMVALGFFALMILERVAIIPV